MPGGVFSKPLGISGPTHPSSLFISLSLPLNPHAQLPEVLPSMCQNLSGPPPPGGTAASVPVLDFCVPTPGVTVYRPASSLSCSQYPVRLRQNLNSTHVLVLNGQKNGYKQDKH